ncbi:MAG: type II toxin-antitoxin system PemK/MazF family toxin [Candidatus Caenarcaniphilales bacterium]|jgi:mRNA interferase MazF|nr:type II toxin-antitoxin system PemK/MazF family toxin [Candidatus Caenarcaniphilales bacterium]
MVKRFEIYWVDLDPTKGSEIKKKRPCIVISPDELNQYLNTVIIAPLTSTIKSYPTRINIKVKNKQGQVALDQIRTIDKSRLKSKIGKVESPQQKKISSILVELFTI